MKNKMQAMLESPRKIMIRNGNFFWEIGEFRAILIKEKREEQLAKLLDKKEEENNE